MTARDISPQKGKAPVPVQCRACGGTILLSPSRAARRVYCSRPCAALGQRQDMAAGRRPRPPGAQTEEGRKRSLENLVRDPEDVAAWWEERPTYWASCPVCSSLFPTRATTAPRFCSERCRQRDAVARGVYKEERACAVCRAPFWVNKYDPTSTCSRRCAASLAWRKRRGMSGQKEDGP